jgi:hypothetical protein
MRRRRRASAPAGTPATRRVRGHLHIASRSGNSVLRPQRCMNPPPKEDGSTVRCIRAGNRPSSTWRPPSRRRRPLPQHPPGSPNRQGRERFALRSSCYRRREPQDRAHSKMIVASHSPMSVPSMLRATLGNASALPTDTDNRIVLWHSRHSSRRREGARGIRTSRRVGCMRVLVCVRAWFFVRVQCGTRTQHRSTTLPRRRPRTPRIDMPHAGGSKWPSRRPVPASRPSTAALIGVVAVLLVPWLISLLERRARIDDHHGGVRRDAHGAAR